jgi:hypothetical protein
MLCSWSGESLPFMENKGLLPCSQGHATGHYPSYTNSAHILTNIFKTLIFSCHLWLGLPSYLFPSDFQTKMCKLVISLWNAISHRFYPLDLINLVIFCEWHKNHGLLPDSYAINDALSCTGYIWSNSSIVNNELGRKRKRS